MPKTAVELSFSKLVLIIATTVFSFTSMSNAYYLMSYGAIPWYILAAVIFFVPYALIVSEFTGNLGQYSGGLYSWVGQSLSQKTAFLTTFLWYSSYTIWLASLFMKVWIPLSILSFGKDLTTAKASFLNIPQVYWLGLGSCLLVFLVMYLISRGFLTISRFMLLGGSLIALLFLVATVSNITLLITNHGHFAQPLQASALLHSPNPQYQGLFGNLSFLIFGITAFGGLDTVASLVDRVGKNRRKFPLAILVAAGLIMGTYLLGIFFWGASANWQAIFANHQVSLGNAMYFLMFNLGHELGVALGLSTAGATILGQVFLRLTGLVLFWAYIGLIMTIAYAPLKSIITGTPTNFWPAFLSKENKFGVASKAVFGQGILICLLIGVVVFSSAHAVNLYNNLTLMTNVSRSIPYLIVALAFYRYRQQQKQAYLLIEQRYVGLASGLVCVSILLGIGFAIFEPLLQAHYLDATLLFIGPLCFSLIALGLYRYFGGRTPGKQS
ncbi:MAG: glutamate/gamma-aminobutyrate family transporter YjeM [Lactobacillus sp.]|jgi:amino acid transporter|nr:glutamate/gamma-aminobutyrate family transporter YjeM [Lactobacillus sp.]